MTYFGFLALFLLIPIIFFAILYRKSQRPTANSQRPLFALALHILMALVYTTPWDNYLVATRVWWYDPELVTGFTIGWVPIEEYTFFIVQPILTGLILLWLMSRPGYYTLHPTPHTPHFNRYALLSVFAIWLLSIIILFSGWEPGTYLGLELGWALLPIMLQIGYGADLLWRYRRLVLTAILPVTLYLSAADALAIGFGTWTINPAQSLDIHLFGVLPVEEFIFFLLTNILIVFGMTLFLVPESQARLQQLRLRLATSEQG